MTTETLGHGTTAAARLRGRHLLGIADLSREEILLILDTAEAMKEIGLRPIKKVPTLRGKTVINLFLENSTRTRISFEIAAKRLSADSINLAASGSSISKGETLADTARNLAAMAPDCIVIRHPSPGAARLLTEIVDCSIINAGDGSHEHPTQALLDLLTIRERKLPVKLFVYDNASLGFVALEMKAAGLLDHGTDLDNPDFAAMARAIGIHGVRVEDPGELRGAVSSALAHDGPCLVNVAVNRQELAMPPTIELEQAKGFTLYMIKAVMSGRGDEIVELAKTNLWR